MFLHSSSECSLLAPLGRIPVKPVDIVQVHENLLQFRPQQVLQRREPELLLFRRRHDVLLRCSPTSFGLPSTRCPAQQYLSHLLASPQADISMSHCCNLKDLFKSPPPPRAPISPNLHHSSSGRGGVGPSDGSLGRRRDRSGSSLACVNGKSRLSPVWAGR